MAEVEVEEELAVLILAGVGVVHLCKAVCSSRCLLIKERGIHGLASDDCCYEISGYRDLWPQSEMNV